MRIALASRTAKVIAAVALALGAAATIAVSSASTALPANYLADYSTSPG